MGAFKDPEYEKRSGGVFSCSSTDLRAVEADHHCRTPSYQQAYTLVLSARSRFTDAPPHPHEPISHSSATDPPRGPTSIPNSLSFRVRIRSDYTSVPTTIVGDTNSRSRAHPPHVPTPRGSLRGGGSPPTSSPAPLLHITRFRA